MIDTLAKRFERNVDDFIEVSTTRFVHDPKRLRDMIGRRMEKGDTREDAIISAVTDLNNGEKVQIGFTRLYEISKMPGFTNAHEITLEWAVTRRHYGTLFDELTIEKAAKRLQEYFGIDSNEK